MPNAFFSLPDAELSEEDRQSKFSVLAQDDKDEWLRIAAQQGMVKHLRSLLSVGANPATVDVSVNSPLVAAVLCQNAECVEALLSVSDLEHRAYDGATALLVAARSWNPKIIQMLLLAGANPRAVDQRGQSVIARAAGMGGIHFQKGADNAREVFGLLMPLADLDARDNEGVTPLMRAAISRSIHAVQCLRAQCDAKLRDPRGNTALMLGARAQDALIVESLLPVSDPWAVNEHAESAFGLACANEDPCCLDLLFPFAPEGELGAVQAIFERGEPEDMPRWVAWTEARALREAANETTPAGAAGGKEERGQPRLPRSL